VGLQYHAPLRLEEEEESAIRSFAEAFRKLFHEMSNKAFEKVDRLQTLNLARAIVL
jgi:hypothetical protein